MKDDFPVGVAAAQAGGGGTQDSWPMARDSQYYDSAHRVVTR